MGGQDARDYSQPHRRVDRGRGYKRISRDHVEVYDIDLAAWILLQDLSISEALKHGKESVITFLDPADEDGTGKIDRLVVDWLNSEAAAFAGAVRQIKKVCLSTQRYRPPRDRR